MFRTPIYRGGLIAALLSAMVLTGCAAPKHAGPTAPDARVYAAAAEINASPEPSARQVSDEEAVARITAIYNQLKPAAVDVCRYIGEDDCNWEVTYSPEEEINAYASDSSTIVIYKGIVQYARNDAEIAMVIAHEMSHHIANHIRESQNSQAAGALIGGLAMAVLLGATDTYYPDGVQVGMMVGAMAGVLTYSRKQEMEADYIAAYIISKSGFGLEDGRGILVKLGRISGGTTSTVLDTHPAGPERVAAWDLAAEEIQSGSPMPQKR